MRDRLGPEAHNLAADHVHETQVTGTQREMRDRLERAAPCRPTLWEQRRGRSTGRPLEFSLKFNSFQFRPPGKLTPHELTGHLFSYGRSLGTNGRQVVRLSWIWSQLVAQTLSRNAC